MKKARLIFPAISAILVVLLLATNLYHINKQNHTKDTIARSMFFGIQDLNSRVNFDFDALPPEAMLSDITPQVYFLQSITGIYKNCFGDSKRDNLIKDGADMVSYMTSDYSLLFHQIENFGFTEEAKDILRDMNAYLSLITEFTEEPQSVIEERLIILANAKYDEEMIAKYGYLHDYNKRISDLGEWE